jgi:hypothetical protein
VDQHVETDKDRNLEFSKGISIVRREFKPCDWLTLGLRSGNFLHSRSNAYPAVIQELVPRL